MLTISDYISALGLMLNPDTMVMIRRFDSHRRLIEEEISLKNLNQDPDYQTIMTYGYPVEGFRYLKKDNFICFYVGER